MSVAQNWKHYLYDDAHSAYVKGQGNITNPTAFYRILPPTGGTFGSIVVGDIDNDGKNEIVAYVQLQDGSYWLYVYAGENGQFKHSVLYDEVLRISDLELADMDGDGVLDIIVTGGDYGFKIYKGSDLSLLWEQATLMFVMPVSGDVNGDGLLEIIAPDYESPRYVHLYNGQTGAEIWKSEIPGSVYDLPLTADINGDGHNEIVLHCHEYPPPPFPPAHYAELVIAFDRDGNRLWTFRMQSLGYISAMIADFDNDGHLEILTGCDEAIYLLDAATGALKWTYLTNTTSYAAHYFMTAGADVADVNHDGILDIQFALNDIDVGDNKGLYTLRGTDGALERKECFPAPASNWIHSGTWYPPVAVDINGDGIVETLLSLGHYYVAGGVYHMDESRLVAYDNAGDQKFAIVTKAPENPSTWLELAVVADINGDDLLEILTTDYYTKAITAYSGALPLVLLPEAHLLTPYSRQIPSALMGTLTYSLSFGSLPSGMVLEPNGYLSGIPTTAGIYSFVVGVAPAPLPTGTVTNHLNVTLYVNSGGYIMAPTPFRTDAVQYSSHLAANAPSTPLNYYIDPVAGADTNDGSQAHPFQTVAKALTLVPDPCNVNFTVNLAAGNYGTQRITGQFNITPDGLLTIQGHRNPIYTGLPTAATLSTRTIQFASPGWTPNALVGKILFAKDAYDTATNSTIAFGQFSGVIIANTSDTVTIVAQSYIFTANFSSLTKNLQILDPSGVGGSRFVQPIESYNAPIAVDARGPFRVFDVGVQAQLMFRVTSNTTAAFVFANSTFFGYSGSGWGWATNSPNIPQISACYIENIGYMSAASLAHCYVNGMLRINEASTDANMNIRECKLSRGAYGYASIGHGVDHGVVGIYGNMILDGVHLEMRSFASFFVEGFDAGDKLTINNAVTHAVHAQGKSRLWSLMPIVGTGSVGFGMYVVEGSSALLGPGNTVSGTLGQITVDGSTALAYSDIPVSSSTEFSTIKYGGY